MDIPRCEEKIGIVFKDKTLLVRAFIHRSYLNENPGGIEGVTGHNERLEFLGDAVLELSVTDYLYKQFPEKTEGELTSFRAALVNATTVGETGSALGMNDFLLLSKGESRDTGRARQIILANAYEALLGAIYLDQGYPAADQFVNKTLLPRLTEIVEKSLWLDAKSFFQEKAQDVYGVTPTYKVLNQAGPDHDRVFTIGVYVGQELVAQGSGHSKQEGEQSAAKMGLQLKGWR